MNLRTIDCLQWLIRRFSFKKRERDPNGKMNGNSNVYFVGLIHLQSQQQLWNRTKLKTHWILLETICWHYLVQMYGLICYMIIGNSCVSNAQYNHEQIQQTEFWFEINTRTTRFETIAHMYDGFTRRRILFSLFLL